MNQLEELRHFLSDGLGNLDDSIKITDVWNELNRIIAQSDINTGDRVVITGNISDHRFEIGDIGFVYFADPLEDSYEVTDGSDHWYLSKKDIDKI